MINTKKLFLFIIMFSLLFSQGKALNSASVYIKDKDWKQAEFFLLQAVEHPKDKWTAAFHLGDKVYVRSQDWAKVKQYMDLASTAPEGLKIRPTRNDSRIPIQTAITASLARSFQLIYFKATGYISLINKTADVEQHNMFIEQAIKTANQAKILDPNQPAAHALLGLYHSLKKDKENTLNSINQSLAIEGSTDDEMLGLLTNAGECAVRINELDLASDYLEKALLIDPDDISVLQAIATVYSRNNDYVKAIDIINKTLDQTEDVQELADLHFNLGTIYLRQAKGFDGEEAAKEVILATLFSEDEDEDLSVKEKLLRRALYHFGEVSYYAPDDTDAIFRLAISLEEAKRFRAALGYYKDLINMDPNNPAYYRGAYRSSFNGGDQIAAKQYLDRAKALEN